jgi:hypothetical protein
MSKLFRVNKWYDLYEPFEIHEKGFGINSHVRNENKKWSTVVLSELTELVIGNDTADQSGLERRLGVDRLPGEQHHSGNLTRNIAHKGNARRRTKYSVIDTANNRLETEL